MNWPELELKRQLKTKLEHVHDARFIAQGSQLVLAGGSPAESGEVEIFSWPQGQLVASHQWHEDLIFALAWSPRRRALITAGLDGVVQVHALPGGQLRQKMVGHSKGVKAIAMLDQEGIVISGSIDHSLRVWDITTGLAQRTFNNHTRPVHDLAVMPTGQRSATLPMIVSVSTDRTVRFWQPTIGRMVRFLRLERAAPLAVNWLPGGKRVVVACDDGHLRIVDVSSVKVLHDLPVLTGWAYCLAVAPDGKSVVIGGEQGQYYKLNLP